jgi:hypothetical protein
MLEGVIKTGIKRRTERPLIKVGGLLLNPADVQKEFKHGGS